eukprot:3220671-Pyramimonas_sp.AAC.2
MGGCVEAHLCGVENDDGVLHAQPVGGQPLRLPHKHLALLAHEGGEAVVLQADVLLPRGGHLEPLVLRGCRQVRDEAGGQERVQRQGEQRLLQHRHLLLPT